MRALATQRSANARRMCVLRLLCTACTAVATAACGSAGPFEPSIDEQAQIPRSSHCDPAQAWDPQLIEAESELLDAINALRADGVRCGTRGSFEPAPPLATSGALHCAARLHSLDMADRVFFDHDNPDGDTPWDRIRSTDYAFATADETIASANMTPRDILREIWLPREGSCAALAASAYLDIGVGAVDPPELTEEGGLVGRVWTVVVAKPLE